MRNTLQKLFTLILFFAATTSLQAQADKVYMHNGEVIDVNVSSLTEKSIVFTYPGETTSNSKNKSLVEKIVYKSGRTEVVTDKIIVNGEGDWANVIITNNPDDISGLKLKGEVKGKTAGISFNTAGAADKKASMRLKMDAAKLGAHIILIRQDKQTTAGSANSVFGFGGGSQSLMSGNAYGYK
jgi:hypothetical protein